MSYNGYEVFIERDLPKRAYWVRLARKGAPSFTVCISEEFIVDRLLHTPITPGAFGTALAAEAWRVWKGKPVVEYPVGWDVEPWPDSA